MDLWDLPALDASADNYARIIRSCANSRDLATARRIHLSIKRSRHTSDVFLSNLLIQMYGKCGSVADARGVFDACAQLNLYSWNLMLTAYTQNGNLLQAQRLFECMPKRDAVSWNVMINGLARNGQVDQAKNLFNSMANPNASTFTTMITAYARQRRIAEAKSLFDRMPDPDLPAWNALLSGYVLSDDLNSAERLFRCMSRRDAFTSTTMIAAFAQKGRLDDAKALFDRMPRRDAPACNAMIQCYAKAGKISEAKALFAAMSDRDEVSWSVMTTAIATCGDLREALELYEKMPSWNLITCTSMIGACCRRGETREARALFDGMPRRDVAAWNAMLAGYRQAQEYEEVVSLFRRMDVEGVRPDEITLATVFDACADLPLLQLGRALHSAMEEAAFPADLIVQTSVVNMYGRCGRSQAAWSVFEGMKEKSMISWSAMISAFAMNGRFHESLELFEMMNQEGVAPGERVFVTILFACSHAGLLEKGMKYFGSMADDYNVGATDEHLPCLVDLLGRSGWLSYAQQLVEKSPSTEAWATLLASCKLHENKKLATQVAGIVSKLDRTLASPYVLLSSVEKLKLT